MREMVSSAILGSLLGTLFLVLLVSLLGVRTNPGQCRTFEIDSIADDIWWQTGGHGVQVQLEPDFAGANVGVTVDVYSCSRDAADACGLYWWDTDNDGVVDSHTLDGGVSAGNRGNEYLGIAGWIWLDVTAVSGGGAVSEIVLCSGN